MNENVDFGWLCEICINGVRCNIFLNSINRGQMNNSNFYNLLVILFMRFKNPFQEIYEYKKRKNLKSLLATLKNNAENCQKNNSENFLRIYNISIYVCILDYDISFLKKRIIYSINDWEKKLHARTLAVQLYESSQNLPNMFGKKFRAFLPELGVSKNHIECFNLITKKINNFKTKNYETLNKIRNYIGAHRDQSGIDQLKIIDDLDPIFIMKVAADFYSGIFKLIPFLISITEKMEQPDIILKEYKSF